MLTFKNEFYICIQVSGDHGDHGLSVPRPVVEELKLGRDIVSVVQTVKVVTLNIESVTLNPATSKVKLHIALFVALCP